MKEVTLFKVEKETVATQSLYDEDYMMLSMKEPDIIIDCTDDVVINAREYLRNCKVYRMCNLFKNCNDKEKLIAFDPSFKELLLSEVVEKESKQEMEYLRSELSSERSQVNYLLSRNRVLENWSKYLDLKLNKLKNSFFMRLKFLLLNKL